MRSTENLQARPRNIFEETQQSSLEAFSGKNLNKIVAVHVERVTGRRPTYDEVCKKVHLCGSAIHSGIKISDVQAFVYKLLPPEYQALFPMMRSEQ